MARKPRQQSNSGIYFVYFEATFGLKLFSDNDDYNTFSDVFLYGLNKYSCSAFAYALNEKCVYMLIKENEPDTFSMFMRTLISSYALKYNRKYLRSGTITADRFKSIPIESDNDCISAAVFIHNAAKTDFSSKREYYESSDGLCDKDYILNKISSDDFLSMHNAKSDFEYIPRRTNKLSDERIMKIITKYTGPVPKNIEKLSKSERDEIIRTLRIKEGLSIGTLERLTGISRGIITRAYNKNKPVLNKTKKKNTKKTYPDTTDYKTRNDVIAEKIIEKKKEEIWLL